MKSLASRLAFLLLGSLAAACSSKTKYEPQADREGVANVVKKRLPELSPCYEEAIDKKPGAEGKMVLEWELTPEGKVDNPRVKSVDKKIESATGCVLDRLSRWQFPVPPNGQVVTITYPFVFSENGRLTPAK